jgi:hypothetical protein
MSEPIVVGTQPWLPGSLGRSRWWTAPLPAERLAALRIGLAAVLLVDVLALYLPRFADFFGPDSLGGLAGAEVGAPHWTRWLLGPLLDTPLLHAVGVAWALAAVLLLVGWWSRLSAAACWILALLLHARNPHVHNAGDTVRITILFYLMLCPCGAAWSVDTWRRHSPGRLFVYPWPVCLLFVQMTLIYFYNGVHKLLGPQWRAGHALHYVLADLTLTRASYAQLPAPYVATQVMTWVVLVWEVGFPLLVLWRPTRLVALVLGAAFHIGIGLTLELGVFQPYMLCLYVPLLPWERLARTRGSQNRG